MKVLAVITLVVGILLLSQGKYTSIEGLMTISIGTSCIFASIIMFVIGFIPNIVKFWVRVRRYLIDDNKEDLRHIASTKAYIKCDAIEKMSGAIKMGLRQSVKHCKHCGAETPADSKFCKHCGKEQ